MGHGEVVAEKARNTQKEKCLAFAKVQYTTTTNFLQSDVFNTPKWNTTHTFPINYCFPSF